MKFYSHILAMKKEGLFIMALMIWGIGMLVWTFFWWSSNEPVITDETQWFVEKIENPKPSIEISPSTQQPTPQTQNKWYTEVRLIMPHYFYTAWWKNFAQDLYNQKKIYIKFIFIDNLNDYRDSISNDNFSWADIALLPYDWVWNISTNTFILQWDLDSVFDDLVKPIVKQNKLSFIPFAVDPMIMYTLSAYSWQSNFYEISEFTDNRSSTKAMSFPLFFGITSEDHDNEWFVREYQDIIRYALIHYFTKYRDEKSLGIRIDSNVFQKYNIQTLKTIIKSISNENCKNFPAICLQIYNFAWIRFWFLSDYSIVRQYFSNRESQFNKLKKYEMPFFSLDYPIRLWWFSILGNVKDENISAWARQILIEYLNKHNSYELRHSTLSVFAWSGTSLTENEFIWTRNYILDEWWNYMDKLKNTTVFWNLIEYQITPKEYLKKAL